jgi:hypothetical protein
MDDVSFDPPRRTRTKFAGHPAICAGTVLQESALSAKSIPCKRSQVHHLQPKTAMP